MIITSKSPRCLLEPIWRRTFGDCGFAIEIFDFAGECSSSEISRGAAAAKAFQATTIIGAGGGKALDMARAIAGLLDLPIACCPTTAAGGCVDAQVAARALGLDVDRALARCDAHPLLDAIGGLVVTGPTGTNVADLRVVLARPGRSGSPSC